MSVLHWDDVQPYRLQHGHIDAWWQLGLPRVVFADELAPRVQDDTAGMLGNGS